MARRVVSVLGIVVFHTCGYKNEAIFAFGTSKKKDREKKKVKQEDRENKKIFGSTFLVFALDMLSFLATRK